MNALIVAWIVWLALCALWLTPLLWLAYVRPPRPKRPALTPHERRILRVNGIDETLTSGYYVGGLRCYDALCIGDDLHLRMMVKALATRASRRIGSRTDTDRR